MTSPRSSSRSGAPRSQSGGRSQSGSGQSRRPAGGRSGAPSTVVYSAGPDTARASKAFGVTSFLDGATTASAPSRGGRLAPVDREDRPVRTDRSNRSDRPRRSDTSGRPDNSSRTDRPATGRTGQPESRGSGRPDRDASPTGGAPRRQRRSGGTGGSNGAAPQRISPSAGTTRRDSGAAASRSTSGTAGSAALFASATTITAAAAPVTDTSFADLGVPENLVAPLAALGAIHPFPIQVATLPTSLTGRDVLGRGRTGSGKTIAFAIPLVTRLTGGRRTPNRPRGLILLPTRELALQVQRTVEPLAKAAGLKTVTIFGGVGFGPQTSALRSGVDIVIACPGRLEDLISQRACDLSDVEVTVLDEADHMADLGFLPGVRRLLRATKANGQRLLFSATLDNGISVLVNDFLHDPAVLAVDDETSPVEAMTHHVFAVSKDDRNQIIRELASGGGRRLLFTRTKYGAKKWAAALSKTGIPAVDLHGNLNQNARERNLAAFSSGHTNVLVATDIAARGIHVDDIELVVHLDPPAEHKAYLHRSGRTARAGAGGTVVTVMLPEQADDVRKLMKQAGISASTTTVVPGHPAIGRIAG